MIKKQQEKTEKFKWLEGWGQSSAEVKNKFCGSRLPELEAVSAACIICMTMGICLIFYMGFFFCKMEIIIIMLTS